MDKLPNHVSEKHGAVTVSSVSKKYGSFVALDDVSLAIRPGEFVALLGPSGSGKSTLLMMIAGFERPTTGQIYLDDTVINDVPAHARGLGIVFQSYALFPHMTVAENIAYPLRRRGMSREEVQKEVSRALRMVALEAYGARLPAQLSGGQQQRVALARALVFRPPVLLMDEPLGALDRKLRQQLQVELKLLHKKLGSTIIFVTHDQEEALSMADRVAVMGAGRIEQFGTPRELYEEPCNTFVADFIGEMNFIPVEITHGGSNVDVANFGANIRVTVPSNRVFTTERIGKIAIRPEHICLTAGSEGSGLVVESSYSGTSQSVLVEIGGHRLVARTTVVPGQALFSPGQRVKLSLDTTHLRVFSN